VVKVNAISQDLTSPSVSTDTKNTALTLYLLLSYLLYSRQSIDAEEKDEHDAWSEGEYESEGPTGTENDDQLQSRASYVPSLANYICLQSDQDDQPHEQDRYIIQQYMNQLSDGVPLVCCLLC